MSKSKNGDQLSNGGSDGGSQDVSIMVMRTSDAKREKFTIPLSAKLSDVREMLAKDDRFGIPPEQQRIFYMGRELKSGSRSLSNLGVGKFPRIVLHLHKRPEAAAAAKKREKNDSTEQGRKRRRVENNTLPGRPRIASQRQRQRPNIPNPSEVVDLVDSASEDEVEEEQQQANQAAPAANDVVDLLYSDPDDESDSDFENDAEKDGEDEEASNQREVIEID